MTLAKFEIAVRGDGVGQNDQVWFPKWVRRYAMNFRNGLVENLPVNRNSVIGFSKSLLRSGAPAWQRLQAVRALEYYRDSVLQRSEPRLTDVILTLTKLAKRERNLDVDSPPTATELEKLGGNINQGEPPLIQTMRSEMRVLHYSMDTERAYVRWVKNFCQHVGSQALEQFDERDIGEFLTTLAVAGNVSPSTQNQAQSALLYVYQGVIGKKIGFVNATRARKSDSIPVWFSQSEIEMQLEHFVGEHRLMFFLIYGAGLRHKECRRLRIKDICFDEQHIVVRDGKGAKDRITFLPKHAVPELQRQIAVAKRLHRSYPPQPNRQASANTVTL